MSSFPFLNGIRVLDGGLATELESKGFDLDHPLWSAHILDRHPEAVRDVHLDYLRAGAECLIGAGYQASLPGLAACGYTPSQSRRLLRFTVEPAQEARELFLSELETPPERIPVVAAGVGPYGAYLADGSEFRGRYGRSHHELVEFHQERLEILWQAKPDILAIETVPCHLELQAILDVLSRRSDVSAWISFSCRDGRHLNDGTPIREIGAACVDAPGVHALGINCTAPKHVSSLIAELRRGAPDLPILVYPNSGEIFDGETRSWTGTGDPEGFGRAAARWFREGASAVGGCCRTGPRHIREIRQALESLDP